MKNKVLLICLSLLISLGVSAQKYTIYIDDFNSEIKIACITLNPIDTAIAPKEKDTDK